MAHASINDEVDLKILNNVFENSKELSFYIGFNVDHDVAKGTI
jgi:hypothetical protein